MRRAHLSLALAIASLAAGRVGHAQRAAACPAIDSSAAWFTRQRAWLDESQAKWSDTTLRTTLLQRGGGSASNGSNALLGYEISGGALPAPLPGDAAILAQLKALASVRGSKWPTRSVVGARGVLSVWDLAARDTTFAAMALHRMMEAGPDESPPAAVAILEDRMRVRAGRKQLYGTQLQRRPDGSVAPFPIEDEAHLALRRDGAELPPLAQSLCAARRAAR